MTSTLMASLVTAAAAAKDAAGHGAGGSGGGLPQLNVNDFSPQLIWLALTFIALYFLASKMALPRVGEVLQERADRIRKDLDEAKRLKSETEAAMAAYQQSLSEARTNAQKIVQENRDKLNAEIAKERADVDARIAAKTADAEASIARAKSEALGKVDEIAADTASSIVEALIGEKVSPAEVAQAVRGATR